jgi:hypothetical protein
MHSAAACSTWPRGADVSADRSRLTAGFGVFLIGAAGAFVLLSQSAPGFRLLQFSGYTPFIIVIAMRAAFVYERRAKPPQIIEAGIGCSLSGALLRYSGAAAMVVAAGAWLPFVGQELATVMGWKTTFVGTLPRQDVRSGAKGTFPSQVVNASSLFRSLS